MALKVVFYRRAQKELQYLPKADRDRLLERLHDYALDPDNPHHAVIALVGEKPTRRLRVGDWRVLFDRVGDKIKVRGVRHRREAYR
jgi:mRNA-degrading endonuclease RelE of RelBE toxin-antitoxin system